MRNLKSDLTITNPEIIPLLYCDILDEKIDLIHQKVFLQVGNQKFMINEILANGLKNLIRKEDKIEYSENYEIINDYFTYIRLIQELFDRIKIKNELERAILLKILIEEGYFSINQHFSFNIVKEKIKMFQGLEVIIGNGCCRNISSFYQDIFIKENHPLIFGGTLSSDGSISNHSNHVMNLIKFHDKLYGYDLTNGLIFSFVNRYQMKASGNKTYYMTYTSYWDLVYTDYELNEINNNLDNYASSISPTISTNKHIKYIKEVNKIIDENAKLLVNFHNKTDKIRQDIKEKILVKK